MYSSIKWHGVNINMTQTFFEVIFFVVVVVFKKKQTNAKFDLFKKI